MSSTWHAMDKELVVETLKSGSQGLSSEEAKRRLSQYGYNELVEKKKQTALQMFLEEFKDIFILLLIAATIFSIIIGYYETLTKPEAGFLETYADAIVIGIIVALVGIAGFVQEYRAEKAVEALKKLAAPRARVLRDGKEMVIPAREVVPGDMLVLESGDTVPADARLIEAIELKADEAVLTGESTPVVKHLDSVKPETLIADRKDMLFMATHTIYGRGKAVVVTTGMNTEFGKIAELVQTTEEEETPLQRKLDTFATKIAKVVVVVCVAIFLLEVFDVVASRVIDVEGFIQAFLSSISLAISAVPEGLPAIVTITLALSAREYAKRNAIIRKLSSAESLGATTVICSDKTGTLTKGEMTVRRLYANGKTVEVTGVGYEPKGEFNYEADSLDPKNDPNFSMLLTAGTLCNNAKLTSDSHSWGVMGDPTEGALIVASAKAGLEQGELQAQYPRLSEIPFTSERKCMSTVHKAPDGTKIAFIKGAPEIVLGKCNDVLEEGKEKKLTAAKRKNVLETNEQFATDALRVLAIAYRQLPETLSDFNEKTVEDDLVLAGLEGMIDPPREEAAKANETCQKAGIKTVMITGDHKLTAMAVAKEIGMLKEDSMTLTGAELDSLSDADFEKMVENVAVYARVSPEHKLRIVKAWKAKGDIVAMTGDGVNDAPAVKSADVGVSMGISGTDVTREASDLILTDDNFATIVKAVEQGRVSYDNIRKYARFLISANFDELLVIGTFAVLGGLFGPELFPLPLLPAMILWINLATDGGPALALSMDPPDEDVMKRPPRKPSEGILHGMGAFIIVSFVLQSAGTILVFVLEYYLFPAHPWGWPNGPFNEANRLLTLEEARTTAFVQAAMFELFVVWNCRSETRSVWRMGRQSFKNKYFAIAATISILATLGIAYVPVTAQMFGLVPLSPIDLLYVFAVASWGLFVFPELFMRRKIWRWS